MLYETMPPYNIGLCFFVKANEDVAPSVLGRFEAVIRQLRKVQPGRTTILASSRPIRDSSSFLL